MAYQDSHEDQKLRNWFRTDMSKALLRQITLVSGEIRGLKKFSIAFNYPITVIAGRNGSGKTTLLALAACAFHNRDDGFKLINRKSPYYTYSDFLIQSKDEVSPDGISVDYSIAHDNWIISVNNPDKVGIKRQNLSKAQGGKWRTYSARAKRAVVFFGIDRVVPHSEKSVSKSYRSSFKSAIKNGCEEKVRNSVSKVLGSKYDDFHFKSHSKYRLPFVKRGNLAYSGFNMGAGENALFEIFYNLHVCPEGTLAIIDEIELGLHQQAQKRLISELKDICLARKIQIICTTHSPAILSEVPHDARFFIENFADRTVIIPQISAEFATGKFAGENSKELFVYVEDSVAETILRSALNKALRSRVIVVPIGSDSAIIALLAGKRKEGLNQNCIGILDGDKVGELPAKRKAFIKKLESYSDLTAETKWIDKRLITLPGATWPEKWILSKVRESLSDQLANSLGTDTHELAQILDGCQNSGKHSELYDLAAALHLEISFLSRSLCAHVVNAFGDEFIEVQSTIRGFLGEAITEESGQIS